MPQILAPVLKQISGQTGKAARHVVTGSFNFAGETPVNLNYNGFQFAGVQVVIDYGSLPFAQAGNLPAAQTILINATFNEDTDSTDGALVVYVPDTGVMYVLTPNSPSDTGGNLILSVALAVPTNSPSKIFIAKGKTTNNVMYGKVSYSIFDWDMPGVNIQGTANIS